MQVDYYRDHILVTYFGKYEANPLIDLGLQIVSLSSETDQSKVLLDLTHSEGKLSLIDRYVLVEKMSENWPKHLKLSVVVKPSQTLKVAGFIWQRLAASKGFDVSLDFSLENGARWLKC